VHIDVTKLGVIRAGGGWRVHGHGSAEHNHSRAAIEAGQRVGYDSRGMPQDKARFLLSGDCSHASSP
jgi:hypothetical protein